MNTTSHHRPFKRMHHHRPLVALGAAASVCALALAACTDSQPGSLTKVSRPVSSPHGAPAPGQAKLHLGDLNPPPDQDSTGAPFDPCTIITWRDFNEAVRNPKETPPTRNMIQKDDPFSLRCTFTNSGAINIATDGTVQQPSSTANSYFMVQVVWGKEPKMSGKQSDYKHSEATTYNGRPGWHRRTKSDDGAPICTAWLPLAYGIAGVNTINSRFPKIDTCGITDQLLTAIANRVP
jgi:uncharacterized protein DUF3558